MMGFAIPALYWWLATAALALGLLTLYAMDRVYQYFQNPFHSAGILLTGFMWIALILQEPLPLFFIILIKTALYIWRKMDRLGELDRMYKWMSVVRLVFLVLVPAVIITLDTSLVLELFFPLLAGECIDRLEFYRDQQMMSPSKELERVEQEHIFEYERIESEQINHKTETL